MPAQLVAQSASPSIPYDPPSYTPIQSLLTSLRSPIASLQDLEAHLLQFLAALDITPAPFVKPSTTLSRHDAFAALPTIQHVVMSVLLPTWLASLSEADHLPLVKQLFCPLRVAPGETRCKIVTSALPTLLAHLPMLSARDPGPRAVLEWCLCVLEEIVAAHPLSTIHESLFPPSANQDERKMRDWEDYVRIACSVPGKVANALHGRTDIKPRETLVHGAYFSEICKDAARLISQPTSSAAIPTASHTYLLLKLITLGLFPRAPPTFLHQPSFFAVLPPKLSFGPIVRVLPATAQQTLTASLLGALILNEVGLDAGHGAHAKVRTASALLKGVMGALEAREDEEQLWGTVRPVVCGAGGTWSLGVARAVVWWIADPQHNNTVNEKALEKLLDAILATWADSTYIRHSLLTQHLYMSTLLLLTILALPAHSSSRISLHPPFIAAISTYLGHLDAGVRRCGMLSAEIVAQRCGRSLAFGGWDAEGSVMTWARTMRHWEHDWARTEPLTSPSPPSSPIPEHVSVSVSIPDSSPIPGISGYDSDDSLTGYPPSPPSSSRAPSPTPSALAEIEADPTVRPPIPPPRPVYLAQLGTLLRSDEADGIEVALKCAEGLVRRKKGFGLELEENAVDLAIALLRLHDNFELPQFDARREAALIALVACCPYKSALTLVEQFFTNQYAVVQRITVLAALTHGARELAGDSGGKEAVFPSRLLPPALHRRYLGPDDLQRHALLEDARGKDDGSAVSVVRTRQLRVGRLGSTRITPLSATDTPHVPTHTSGIPPAVSFIDVAAEYFIMPLINHMWRYLHARGGSGAATGTGLVLTPVVLSQYLGTLTSLLHGARNAPVFLAVLAPAALELVLALGSQPQQSEDVEEEGAVLGAALQCAGIVLHVCVVLDGGRDMALGRTALVLGVGEWVGTVLQAVGIGRRVRGEGGMAEGRVGSAAAGVLGEVEIIMGRWGRSMVTQ